MALRNESAALQGVTCCCLVSVCFFSTLISLKIFNSKTLEASRTERNWQSQLRAGFGAVAALSWEGGAWEKHVFGKMCNRVLLHFSLEQLLLNSVHSSSMCCSLKGRSKSYKLLFIFCSGFLCSPRVMGPCSGFPAGLVLLVKPKVKAGTELPGSHDDPAHNSHQPFLPNTEASSHLTLSFLSLCPPASPKVLTPAAVPCPSCCPLCTVQPPPPPASSCLLLPSYVSSCNDFKTLLLPDSCPWLLSRCLLCLHTFTYDSTIFQSPDQAKWTDGGREESVTWLCSNLRFSLSLLLCLWLPLTVLLRFLTQMIN